MRKDKRCLVRWMSSLEMGGQVAKWSRQGKD